METSFPFPLFLFSPIPNFFYLKIRGQQSTSGNPALYILLYILSHSLSSKHAALEKLLEFRFTNERKGERVRKNLSQAETTPLPPNNVK